MANNFIRAVAFAAEKHRDQRRKDADASPYINHPIALANVLANEGDSRYFIPHGFLVGGDIKYQSVIRPIVMAYELLYIAVPAYSAKALVTFSKNNHFLIKTLFNKYILNGNPIKRRGRVTLWLLI